MKSTSRTGGFVVSLSVFYLELGIQSRITVRRLNRPLAVIFLTVPSVVQSSLGRLGKVLPADIATDFPTCWTPHTARSGFCAFSFCGRGSKDPRPAISTAVSSLLPSIPGHRARSLRVRFVLVRFANCSPVVRRGFFRYL